MNLGVLILTKPGDIQGETVAEAMDLPHTVPPLFSRAAPCLGASNFYISSFLAVKGALTSGVSEKKHQMVLSPTDELWKSLNRNTLVRLFLKGSAQVTLTSINFRKKINGEFAEGNFELSSHRIGTALAVLI